MLTNRNAFIWILLACVAIPVAACANQTGLDISTPLAVTISLSCFAAAGFVLSWLIAERVDRNATRDDRQRLCCRWTPDGWLNYFSPRDPRREARHRWFGRFFFSGAFIYLLAALIIYMAKQGYIDLGQPPAPVFADTFNRVHLVIFVGAFTFVLAAGTYYHGWGTGSIWAVSWEAIEVSAIVAFLAVFLLSVPAQFWKAVYRDQYRFAHPGFRPPASVASPLLLPYLSSPLLPARVLRIATSHPPKTSTPDRALSATPKVQPLARATETPTHPGSPILQTSECYPGS